MKKLKIGIVGVGRSANVGDGLIANMIKLTLGEVSSNLCIDVSFFDIDSGEYDISQPIESSDEHKNISEFKNRLYLPRAIKNIYKNLTDSNYKSNAFEFIKEQDLIIVGGGHLLIDNYAHFLSKLYIINKICKKNSTELFYWCVGVSRSFSPISKFILYRATRNRKIYTRDSNSLLNLRSQLDKEINAKCIADPAIFCGDYFSQENESTSIAIGIMDPSEMKRHSHYEISRMDYAEKYIKLINSIPKEIDVKVFCNGNINDYLFIKEFIKPYVIKSNTTFLKRPKNHMDLIRTVSDCKYVFAQRLHAVLPSISLGKRVIALKWDLKLESIVCDLGLESILYEPKFEDSIIEGIINSEKIDLSILKLKKETYMKELKYLLEAI